MSDRFAVVARFSFPHEAHIAKACLQSEGIEAFVADEHTINMQWLYSGAMGGVRLMVESEHLQSASEILSQDFSESVVAHCESLPEWCPECGSRNIEAHTQGKRAAFVVFLLAGFPLFFYKHGLRCKDCQHFWRPKRDN